VNAPVTKALVIGVLCTTLFASISGTHARLSLSGASAQLQPHRVLTHHLLFSTPGELLFGITLLYFFRQAERQWSSSRTAALFAAAAALHTAFTLALALALPSAGPHPAPGPYGLLLPLFIRYFFDTPKIYSVTLLSHVPLSDKSFPYLLLAQLLLSGLPDSLLSALSAAIAGLILRLPCVAAALDCPPALSALCARHILPWMDTAPRARPSNRRRRPAGATAPLAPAAVRPQVDEAGVATLTGMGFTREQAIGALAQSGGDVQAAADRLLQ
jgi:membrane associated rhomboid family serine protease